MSDLVGRLRVHSSDYGMEWLEEAADRIEQLEKALREIDQARYTGRNTISPDNAFENAISLNEKLIAVMNIARAALAQETP